MGARREAFESRFGALGTGSRAIVVGDRLLSLVETMERLGLAQAGCRSIDARSLGPDRFMIRLIDFDDGQVVAYEFDGRFRHLAETRVHVAEWVGDDHEP